MVSPLINITRSGENRRNYNRYTPVGMTFVSPGDSVSPLDTRMTPIRKSLFQKRRITSNKRKPQNIRNNVEDDSRNDTNEMEHLRSTNSKKDGQLKILHDRFTHIQKGLGSIDEERNHLVEKANKLDKEKKFIQKQLELREQEILSLIKRCASQEEKMRESSKLRSSNRDLQKNLDLITQRLHEIEDDQHDRNSLKKMLQDSELEREHLKDRLAKVQREHDSIADTLQECLGNIRLLTEEKHAIEEERRRERRRAEIELEKQRLAHVNDSNYLKEDIHVHKNKIHQMEQILQDNMISNTTLRREKAIMSQGQDEEIQEVVQQYERQLLELRTEKDETTGGKGIEHEHGVRELEEEILFMKEKMKSKDGKIEELETEFSGQMVELMSTQSSLDEAEECKKNLELKVESMNNLEIRNAALLDFVQILDSNLAELTVENANLELEKDTLLDGTDELRKKARILQQQFSSLQNNHKAKENDFRDLLNAEKEELQMELEESLRLSRLEVVSLQAELENRNEWIFKLKIELNVALKSIVEKENEIIRIMSEMDNLRSSLGTELRKVRIEVTQFEAEVFAEDQKLASLEGRLEGAKETRDFEEEIKQDYSIDFKCGRKVDPASLEDEADCLCNQLRSQKMDSEKLNTELEGTIHAGRNKVMPLQQKIASFLEEKSLMEKEVDSSHSLINNLDEQIVEKRQKLLKNRERVTELGRNLQNTTNEIDDYKENLSDLVLLTDGVQSSTAKLEDRIKLLEKELTDTQISRSVSVANLEKAYGRIEELKSQLIGKDERTISLESQLQDITNALFEEKSRAYTMEKECSSNIQFQIERGLDNKKVCSEISELEDKIADMKKRSDCKNAEKNEMISSLQMEVAKGEEERGALISKLGKDLQMKIENTKTFLPSKDNRTEELEEFVSNYEFNLKNLEDLLSKANSAIDLLEERIRCQKQEKTTLIGQLREANEISTNVKSLGDDTQVASMEQKIQALLSSQSKLNIKLNKANVILEKEREGWTAKVAFFDHERSVLKAEQSKLQEVASKQDSLISTFQKDSKESKKNNLITNSLLTNTESVISELEKEIKEKEKKIEHFENQVRDKDGEDMIQMERRDELTNMRKRFEDELESARKEITKKNKSILLEERKREDLEGKVRSLDEKLQSRDDSLLKVSNKLETIKTESQENEKYIKSLEEVVEKTKEEISGQKNVVVSLKKIAENFKSDLAKAQDDITANVIKIKSLEDSYESEMESRMNLEGEIAVVKEHTNESQRVKEKLAKELEGTKHENDTLEDRLSKNKNALKTLDDSSRVEISNLRDQITKMTTDLALRDDEIRELRLFELKDAEEIAALLTEEVDSLKEEALHHIQERATEKAELASKVEYLKSQIQVLSLTTESESLEQEKEAGSMTKSIDSLQCKNHSLESRLNDLTVIIDERGKTIHELKEAALLDEKEEIKVCDKHDFLQSLQDVKQEGSDQVERMKIEFEQSLIRERELADLTLKNKDSLHKEELEQTLSEFESILKKLEDSEILLAEKSCRLGEMVDHNRNIESALEKEQIEHRNMEGKCSKGRVDLEETRKDLKNARDDLRNKESVLESKLKEERGQREYAEESLKIVKGKYKEAIRTKRNLTELDRENGELRDKIRRQDTYLQRKLQKEKADRVRLTPTKSIGVPRSISRTPKQRNAKNSRRALPPASSSASVYSRSKIQAPSTIGRRSARTFSRNTKMHTPAKQEEALSPRDILQSDRDDRTATSERSSILRTPKASDTPAVPDWELE